MISRVYIFLFFIIILLILAIAYIIHKYPEKFESAKSDPRCICAFDIDGTITCGTDRAASAIAKCKELGCKITINTARPTKWYRDLDLNSLGLTTEDIESDFYHGEPFQCSFTDITCFEDAIASTKVKHLHSMASKWNVEPRKIILFDDQWSNIVKAKEAGFSIIHADNYLGGLPDNVVQQVENIL